MSLATLELTVPFDEERARQHLAVALELRRKRQADEKSAPAA